MKYNSGDRVKIKTWDQMVKEFGVVPVEDMSGDMMIDCEIGFTKKLEREMNHLFPDRILTITKVCDNYYYYKIRGYFCDGVITNDMIACLAEKLIPFTRFEIMDLE